MSLLSTKGMYGLSAMYELSLKKTDKPTQIKEISASAGIPQNYLEQLLVVLRKAGLVTSIRGAHGGYMLNYDPEDITVADVITTLEGPIAPVDCVIEEDFCNYIDKCVIHGLWSELADAINGVIENMTLADLRDKAVQEKQREEELEKEKLEAK